MSTLTEKKCVPCEGGAVALPAEKVTEMLQQLPDWTLNDAKQEIVRKLTFKNYYQTIAFVNAVAWIANKENHHPDMVVSYNSCHIALTTHAISGLTENDFIVAAKIDKLFAS